MNSTTLKSLTDRVTVDPARPKILYLVHRLPYPPDKGDRIRAFHVLKSLSGKAAVHLACLADEPVDANAIAALKCYCDQLEVIRLNPTTRWIWALHSMVRGRTVTEGAFHSSDLWTLLRRWAGHNHFQAVLASASSMVPYLRMHEFRDVPVVVDLVDVDSQKWFDYAAASLGPKAWLYRIEGHRLRRLEADLPDWVRAVTLVSDAETELYRRSRSSERVHTIVNGVDLDYFRPASLAATSESGCVFVGALDYRPNVDGIVWFCREVWPEIHRRCPQAKVSLVGRRPAPAVRRLADLPGVELIGPVPDVRPFLTQAALVIAPLRIARGVQNKVLEALAMGKAVVASPQALTGLQLDLGVHVLSALSLDDWIRHVPGLLGDEAARRRLGAAGRGYVEQYHHWETCLKPFQSLIDLPETTETPTGISALRT